MYVMLFGAQICLPEAIQKKTICFELIFGIFSHDLKFSTKCVLSFMIKVIVSRVTRIKWCGDLRQNQEMSKLFMMTSSDRHMSEGEILSIKMYLWLASHVLREGVARFGISRCHYSEYFHSHIQSSVPVWCSIINQLIIDGIASSNNTSQCVSEKDTAVDQVFTPEREDCCWQHSHTRHS